MSLQEGTNTKVYSPAGHAEGDGSAVWGDEAHAEGLNTSAVGNKCHVEGDASTCSTHGGHSEGSSNIAGNTPRSFTVTGTTVTIAGAVASEFVSGQVVRFFQLTGGTNGTLHVSDRTISSIATNHTGSLNMYVAQGSSTANPHLYQIDKSTGAVTDKGALLCAGQPVSITGMAMDPTTGIMYAVSGGASPNFTNSLFTLNLSTAALTAIATPMENIINDFPLTLDPGGPDPDISFDVTGQLWATCINTPHYPIYVRIDKTNGRRVVLFTDFALNNTVGLGFAFMTGVNRLFINDVVNLYELDPVSGKRFNVVPISGPAAGIIIGSLVFDENNTLYAVSNNSGVFALYTIDVATGISTSVATLTRDYDSIAVDVALNTTFTINSALDDRTGGLAVDPGASQNDHAEGHQTTAKGGAAHSEGFLTFALNNLAHAEGWTSISTGFASHAEGNANATGDYSHAEGQGSFAEGNISHAEGLSSLTRALAAHAEGIRSIAAANWAHAEGGASTAYGDSSHSEGGSTQVNSEGGHVEGENCRVGNLRRSCTISGTTITIAGGDFTSEFVNGQSARFADLMGGTNQTLQYASKLISNSTFNSGPNTTTFSISTDGTPSLDDRTSGVCYDQIVGQDGHAQGDQTIATGHASHAAGVNSFARLWAQEALAGGRFSASGDAQSTRVVCLRQTTSNTPTQLFIDGSSLQITIAANTTYTYRIDVVARQTGGTDTCAAFYLTGFLTRQSTAASTRINAATTSPVTDAGSSTWSAVATADTTNAALKITVTGENSKNINWVATVWLTETVG